MSKTSRSLEEDVDVLFKPFEEILQKERYLVESVEFNCLVTKFSVSVLEALIATSASLHLH